MTSPAICPFCQYVSAAVDYGDPNVVVVNGRRITFDADRTTISFEPLNPVAPGHMLFVPRAHVTLAGGVEGSYLIAEAARLAYERALYRGEPFNLIMSGGAAATQTIEHLHVHYVPRRAGDGLTLPWTGQQR